MKTIKKLKYQCGCIYDEKTGKKIKDCGQDHKKLLDFVEQKITMKTPKEVRKETEEKFSWIKETFDKYGQENEIRWLEELENRVRRLEKKIRELKKEK